jgi:RNA polymerase sigma factor (sigma-70 family)
MDSAEPDCELVRCYAREGSEPAFRALVNRHINLVFATALRQVGDAGLAEEITQNAFIALARKAPHLAGHETVAGWLHRTAVLEAKACIRAQLRRQRREVTAAEITELRSNGASPLEELIPLLDEGLLGLRETERLALMLRFLEGRSLREVGTALGVAEDAARKRVDRALDRLSEFFRARGFAVPASGGSALLSQAAVHAAPVGLATTSASAGLAAGAGGGGLAALVTPLMALTKTQTAVLCALLAAVPLGWQWRAQSETDRNHDGLAAQLAAGRRQLAALESETEGLRRQLQAEQAETLNTLARVNALAAQRTAAKPAPRHQWDDASAVVRIPKELLRQLPFEGLANKRGELSPQIIEALQLSPAEVAAVRNAIGRFLTGVQALEAGVVERVEPMPGDLGGRSSEEVRVFALPDTREGVAELRETLFAELAGMLSEDRLELFKRSLRNWMPLDDGNYGLSSGAAVFVHQRRLRFFNQESQPPDAPVLGWGVSIPGSGSLTASMEVDDLPSYLRAHLADWIEAARKAQTEAKARTAVPGETP